MHLCWEEQAAFLQWSRKHLSAEGGLHTTEFYPSDLVSHIQEQMAALALPVKWHCLLEMNTHAAALVPLNGGTKSKHRIYILLILWPQHSEYCKSLYMKGRARPWGRRAVRIWPPFGCLGSLSQCYSQGTISPLQEDFCVCLWLLISNWDSHGQTPRKGMSDSLAGT